MASLLVVFDGPADPAEYEPRWDGFVNQLATHALELVDDLTPVDVFRNPSGRYQEIYEVKPVMEAE